MLDNKKIKICCDSAEELGELLSLDKLGEKANEVIASLLLLLDDEEPQVCSVAARSLSRINKIRQADVTIELLKRIRDREISEGCFVPEIITTFGKLSNGSNADNSIDEMLKLLNDDKPSIRSCAIGALVELDISSRNDVADEMLKLLKDSNLNVCIASAQALIDIGNTDIDLVEVLLPLLWSRERLVRSSSLRGLTQLNKTIDTFSDTVAEWFQQNSNHDGIGDAIDCLWSIVVE